jgi:hypothetical protein
MHEKKEKGDIGLAFSLAFCTEQGWTCCVPLSEHQPYDFIAEKNGICKRIQARYTTPKNGVLEVKLRSCWNDKNGSHSITRKKGDFDTLAVYNPHNKEIYFINDNDFENSNTISLRVKEPKKKFKTIRMAKDYLILS